MKTFNKILMFAIIGFLIGAFAFFCGKQIGKAVGEPEPKVVTEVHTYAVQGHRIVPVVNPAAFEAPEKLVITTEMVSEKLKPIGELATYSYEYREYGSAEDMRRIRNMTLPGTTNRISAYCSGIVKVGCRVSDIELEVDNKKQIITVTLPEQEVLDNYLILDSFEVLDSDNNLFNAIDAEEVAALLSQIETDGLSTAERAEIYEEAETHLRELISGLLSAFPDFDVEFENRQ